MSEFEAEVIDRIDRNPKDTSLLQATRDFISSAVLPKYCYNFSFLGRPIIQFPQDMVAVQELIWKVKPDLIIETGVAHGGSLVMSAGMLALLDYCDAVAGGTQLNPKDSKRLVLGIDIDIRQHNRHAIEEHPMAHKIKLIQGSSVSSDTFSQVKEISSGFKRVMVFLDSNHTHDHVLKELEMYAPLTSVGSYCVVFDTVIEDLSAESFKDRPWGPSNNPKTAVWEYLTKDPRFSIDKQIENKIMITVAPDGFLIRHS
jgi:cephalosporin hydroxylase